MSEQVETERAAIVRSMLDRLREEGVELSHETIGSRLEAGFPAFRYSAELDDYTRHLAPIVETTDTIEPAADVMMDSQAILDQQRVLELKIGELRSRITILTRDRTVARSELSQAILALTNKMPRQTDAGLRRDFLAASLAERQHKKEVGASHIPSGATANSVVDKTAAYSGNSAGDASDFVRRNFRGGGFRRGGATRQSLKVPSQR
jgi:hypothetical protein